jgi:hypothetical protein
MPHVAKTVQYITLQYSTVLYYSAGSMIACSDSNDIHTSISSVQTDRIGENVAAPLIQVQRSGVLEYCTVHYCPVQ